MTHARALRFDLEDPVHGQVPCAALVPEQAEEQAHPACLFLYGGGGNRDSLFSLQEAIEAAWNAAELTPCVIATPDVGPWSFYLDDHARGYAWESFITQRLAPRVQALTGRPTSQRLGVVVLSMGGYAALKLAFGHPQLFAAVGAVSPMLEPYTTPNAVPLRNRYFYPPEVPQALLGEHRDEALCQADHPTARARKHANAITDLDVAIYIDAAGRDAVHAQDGAESLHRELWDQDIPHEYHLRRDADHAGPDVAPRLCRALQWVGQHLQPLAAGALSHMEQAWQTWLDDRSQPQPAAPLPPESRLFPTYLRAQLEPLRKSATLKDSTILRHYGQLAAPRRPA